MVFNLPIGTGVAVGGLEGGTTLALARLLLAVSRRVEEVAITRCNIQVISDFSSVLEMLLLTTADVCLIPVFATWTIVLWLTLIAVGSLGVVLAVLTDTSAVVVSMDIQRQALAVDLLIVFTLVAVAMAIAGCE